MQVLRKLVLEENSQGEFPLPSGQVVSCEISTKDVPVPNSKYTERRQVATVWIVQEHVSTLLPEGVQLVPNTGTVEL